MLQHTWKEYAQPAGVPIIVTENGFPIEGEDKMTREEILHDTQRQTYYAGYVKELIEAVRDDGIDMGGYMAWSLLE